MSASTAQPTRIRQRSARGSWGSGSSRERRFGGSGPIVTVAVTAALIVVAVLWVSVSHTRPSYDAFGWMVWGRQVVDHGALNTDGAPSWKPLTFLFTLPYALFGRTQMTLWTLTATAAAFSSAVFAGRIAFHLARQDGERWWWAQHPGDPAAGRARPLDRANPPGPLGPLLGALFAAVAVLFMFGYAHQVFIATSDPMVVALVLAAIDAHLSRRPVLAFGALLMASLGRPETWPFLGCYALWAWMRRPGMRWLVVLGVLLVPAGWFVIPGLTSHSWFVSGDLALKSPDAIHHHQLAGVLHRFFGIYAPPMWIAAGVSVALALVRRDLRVLVLALAAAVWVAVEVGFAYHGWPAQSRYVMEASAVAVVLVGGTVGRSLGGGLVPRRLHPAGSAAERWGAAATRWLLQPAGVAAVAVLLVALAPVASGRIRLLNSQIERAGRAAIRIDRLQSAVDDLGGPARILGCGHPVTEVGYQSTLAWLLGLNVGDVGYKPGREIRSGRPLVYFKPTGSGWQVHPIHLRRAGYARCERPMRLNLDSGQPLPPIPPPPGGQLRRRTLLGGADARRHRREQSGRQRAGHRDRTRRRHHAHPRRQRRHRAGRRQRTS